jgi:hypothetical protein
MEEELKYSDHALLNMDLFFNNEVNFYIEDEGKEYRYETIFNELFDIKIESIFALGGKANLKKKFHELKDKKKLEKCFFIADSDFDYILKKDWIEDQHFIYLQKYEIENYIVDKNAIVKFLKNELSCMESKAEKILNYEEWIKRTSIELYRLFILYLIVQKEEIGIKSTNEGVDKYFNEDGKVSIIQIDDYYEKIKNELKISNKDLNKKMKEMDLEVKEIYGDEWKDIIKGKYYIVGIRKYLSDILRRECKTARKNIKEKSLLDYLFDFFDKQSLSFIKIKVEECLTKEIA